MKLQGCDRLPKYGSYILAYQAKVFTFHETMLELIIK